MNTYTRTLAAGALEVRAEQRTISGIAVPYDTPTEIHDPFEGLPYREQFAFGSFARTINERGPSRVKLLVSHDERRLPIGKATELRETREGLHATFHVSATTEGDTALELARDGTLDGLSVSFQPITQQRVGDLVTRTEVKLREISLCAFPAYDSARVLAVRSEAPTSTLSVVRARLALAHIEGSSLMPTTDHILAGVLARRDNLASDIRRRIDTGTADNDWLTSASEQLEDLNQAVQQRQDDAVRDAAAADLARRFTPDATEERVHRPGVTIGHEQRTYNPPGQRPPSAAGDYLRDLYAAQIANDPSAAARLARHSAEMEIDRPDAYRRAVDTGGVGGFVPPQYMVEMFAEFVRAGRPTANLASGMPLPEDGMTIELPRVTTGTSTDVQTAEGETLANRDLEEDVLSVPVRTIGGYVDVRRQALERGTILEAVVMGDLASDYSTRLDRQVVAGSGLNGQHLGLLNTTGINGFTFTTGSPTVPLLWPKLAAAVGAVVGQRFTGPTAIVMHPNTWAWLQAGLDASGRPYIGDSQHATNPIATAGAPDYSGTRQLQNLPVVLDGNIPTNLGTGENETRIIVADFRDTMLFEDGGPVQLRFDGPGSATLTSRLVAYGYSAFTAARLPKAVSVIAGTGLITPAL
jgi:HK97 family phage prohead protease/HK97 family phage major capsid protein